VCHHLRKNVAGGTQAPFLFASGHRIPHHLAHLPLACQLTATRLRAKWRSPITHACDSEWLLTPVT